MTTEMVINQSGGAGAGAPGAARTDIWRSVAVQLVSQYVHASYAWTLRSRPAGSSSTITGASTANASFTPDVLGSYRVELAAGGKITVRIIRVRRSNTGVLLRLGHVMPAYGERSGEDNVGGNAFSYAYLFDGVMNTLIDFVEGSVANSYHPDLAGLTNLASVVVQDVSEVTMVTRRTVGTFVTPSATPVDHTILAVLTDTAVGFSVILRGRNSSGTEVCRMRLEGAVHSPGGVPALVGTVTLSSSHSTNVGFAATVNLSASNLVLTVTGLAESIRWSYHSTFEAQYF